MSFFIHVECNRRSYKQIIGQNRLTCLDIGVLIVRDADELAFDELIELLLSETCGKSIFWMF